MIKEFSSIFMAIFTYLILPIAGLIVYVRLIRKMRKEGESNIPRGALFLLFVIYGGALMEILTGLFWVPSGMSSLGLLFLIFITPVICGIIARQHRNITGSSKYYRATRRLALGYLLGEAALIGITILIYIAKSIAGTSQYME